MKSWYFAAACVAAMSVAAHAQSTHSLADDAAAFGARDSVVAPRLSPDGSSVMYLTPGPGPATYAVISDLQTGKTDVMTLADGNPEVARWCNYVDSDRAVCRVSGNVDQLGDILGFQRLIAINTDGTDAKLLGQADSNYDAWIRQTDALVLDWRGAVDGKILLAREYVPEVGKTGTRLVREKEGLGVDLVDTRSAHAVHVEPPRDAASGYMTDGRGLVRIMSILETTNNGTMTGRIKYLYRTSDSRDWETLVDFADSDDQIQPLAVDADIDSLYALRKRNGRQALYAIKLDGSMAERLIAQNPRVDIDDVVRLGDGLKVIGYTYADDTRHAVYFDPEFDALADSLSKAVPDLPLIDFVDASNDGRKLLIFAGSDTDPGRYYLFDRDKKALNEAMLARPQLEGRKLAEVKPVSIPAPDGVQIPAYLTLPPGRDAEGLPAVVLPHGGPSARDEWGFDWLAQFLAIRGYAVLQPNYRGSAGYGDTWLNENGFRNWRTSIGDISASARWLASQGIADPNRLAIVGWSYGGYAALQSTATEPALYKAVAAIAPVTDLEALKEEAENFTNASLVRRFVGSGPHVSEGSPLSNVATITAPVLLVHGTMDSNVGYSHSRRMHAALRSAGKQSELLTFEGLDHQLRDSTARSKMLTEIGELLERTIGR